MRGKILIHTVIMIIMITLPTSAIEGYQKGVDHTFKMGADYEMESFTQAPLTWKADGNENIIINITLTNVPDEISSIHVDYITIQKFIVNDEKEIGTPESPQLIVPDEGISEIGVDKMYNETVDSPLTGDLFYMNITIFAKTIGNRTQGESLGYSYRFPVNNTILVSRENDIALINLYGFPPKSFFVKWIPVYLTIIVVFLSPAYVSGYYKLKNMRNKSEVEQN